MLIRAGHTEASVDLARLAGLYPAAVICEVMNDDGTMARMPDLVAFAQRHGLKIGAIEDLIAYRLKNDHLVRAVARTRVDTAAAGAFDLHVYETTVEPGEHLALVKGDLSAPGPVLVRVHAVNALADLLGIREAGEGSRLIEASLRTIEREGRGVVVLIRDLRPKSVSEWIDAAHPQSQDIRGCARAPPGRDRPWLTDPHRPRRARHGAADQLARTRLRGSRRLRPAHRRHAQDR